MEDSLYYATEQTGAFVRPVRWHQTAVLVVDMQNEFVRTDTGDAKRFKAAGTFAKWQPYYERLWQTVVPTTQRLLAYFRQHAVPITYARIASFRRDGRDRSPVQRRPGWNDILLPRHSEAAQVIAQLAPKADDIVVEKTTDSVTNSTGYAQMLRNMDVDTVVVSGIVTDQCVATSVRDLADQGFNVIVVEDGCAAATQEFHEAELKIMNHLYCEVLRETAVETFFDQLAPSVTDTESTI